MSVQWLGLHFVRCLKGGAVEEGDEVSVHVVGILGIREVPGCSGHSQLLMADGSLIDVWESKGEMDRWVIERSLE